MFLLSKSAGNCEEGESSLLWGTVARKTVTALVLRTLVITFGVGKEGHKGELNLCLLPQKMVLSVTFALCP